MEFIEFWFNFANRLRNALLHASLATKKMAYTKFLGVNLLGTETMSPVTEIDGGPSRDFFTCSRFISHFPFAFFVWIGNNFGDAEKSR